MLNLSLNITRTAGIVWRFIK